MNTTDKMIDTAERYAQLYDGDERACITSDVLNAFYAGWIASSRNIQPIVWQPIATAPRDGTIILGVCNHESDEYFLPDGNRLTTYAAHAEGLSHAADGIHLVCWGGEVDCSDGYYGSDHCYISNWWFVAHSDFEVVANPVAWLPVPAYNPNRLLHPATLTSDYTACQQSFLQILQASGESPALTPTGELQRNSDRIAAEWFARGWEASKNTNG
jgi:hypothetical protein